jgi:hypothetical protein
MAAAWRISRAEKRDGINQWWLRRAAAKKWRRLAATSDGSGIENDKSGVSQHGGGIAIGGMA